MTTPPDESDRIVTHKPEDNPKVVTLDPSGSQSVSEFDHSLSSGAPPTKPTKPPKPTPSPKKAARRAKSKKAADDSARASKTKGYARFNGAAKSQPAKGTADLSNIEGVLDRLREIAGGERSADARQACNQLLQHYATQTATDPNAKIDPAQICAYLNRCHLRGKDPADVLIERHGLRKLAAAMGKALGLAHVRLVLGDETGDYTKPGQPGQGDATDQESVAVSGEGVEASA